MKIMMTGMVLLMGALSLTAQSTLQEAGKSVPLIQDVDVVVVGGTCGAVAAAEAAAQAGARVMLVTPALALGEEIAGTLRLWAELEDVRSSALMRNLFGVTNDIAAAPPARLYTTPLRVKKALDSALLDAGVTFLTGAYASDILIDEQGAVAGVIIADRSGRQAIRAKIVIDASTRALPARQAGAELTPFPSGEYTVSRVVIGDAAPDCGGKVIKHTEWTPEADVLQLSGKTRITPALFECEFKVKIADGGARSLLAAEQGSRDLTFTDLQLEAADRIFFVPPDQIRSAAAQRGAWPGAAKLDLGALRPAGVPFLYVLGPLADLSRAAAAELAEPAGAILVGARVGAAAAQEAKGRAAIAGISLRAQKSSAKPADVREVQGTLTAPYVNASGLVVCEAHDLPVLAQSDLVVAGGGTTGGPAAVAAARNGLKTIVVEMLYELGGVQTAGMICGYYYGNQRGFTTEIDKEVKATGRYRSQAKGEWYRRAVREGGGEIWFGSMVVGAVMEDNALRGVVVVTPDGQRGVVLSKAVIDATGNADVAAAAGEPTEFYQDDELIGQGVGQAVIRLGSGGHNNDFAYVDDRDASDICFFGVRTRQMTEAGWDVSQLVNSRERRRIQGVFRLSVLDYLTARTFPDTIIQHKSRFDLHGGASHDFFKTKNIRTANHVTMEANAPYRALLPKITDGLLVAGVGMSADRDAMSILRMQPDLQNQGYAAAYAVYLALRDNCALRSIPVKELQQHLVDKGIIPASVMHEQDSYPLSDSALKMAAHDVMLGYSGLPSVFADPERARPYLREKYKELGTHSSGVDPDVSLIYAHVLAMLGDPAGEDELIAWVKANGWDDKWKEGLGNGQNRMESYLIALGRIKSVKAVPVIDAKIRELIRTKKSFASSRSRAIALTCQAIGDPSLAGALVAVLDFPGIAGHVMGMEPRIQPVPGYSSVSTYSQKEKNDVPCEINLAAALYRVGDKDGRGEAILREYALDPRGFYANYARRVLAEKK